MRQAVELAGCTVEPLAGYLKALGIFRIITEQADSTARGWWDGNVFVIESAFGRDGLTTFFRDQYSPTPIVAPWNGDSGFSEGNRCEGRDKIAGSPAVRLRAYREAILEILSWPDMGGELTLGEMVDEVRRRAVALKPGEKKKDLGDRVDAVALSLGALFDSCMGLTTEQIGGSFKQAEKPVKKLRTAAKQLRRAAGKEEMVPRCRARLGDEAVEWVDAAVVMATGTNLMYPPLLGIGGSDGRLDYTKSFMEEVAKLFLCGRSDETYVENALFGNPVSGLEVSKIGQLDPGRAGGFNQGPEIETKDFPGNRWNFVLAMEGAVAWASGAGRRMGVTSHGSMCSPFTVRAKPIGYESAGDGDEARAEVWVPVWQRPCRYAEIQSLPRQGRVEWNGRGAEDALQFAEAAASLGTDGGVSAFQRYSLLKRRGKSFIALPAGRFAVTDRPGSDLMAQLDGPLEDLKRFTDQFKGEPPAALASARRSLEEAVFDYAARGGPERLAQILEAAGGVERYIGGRDLSRDPKLHRPISGLSPRWIASAYDGTVEFRLAAALASITRRGEVGPLRANLSPVDPKAPWQWARESRQTCRAGATLAHRLVDVLRRRLLDAGRLECDGLPLYSRVETSPEDVAVFAAGETDDRRLEALLLGMTWIQWDDKSELAEAVDSARQWRLETQDRPISRAYALVKQIFDPRDKAKAEPSVVMLLEAGRVEEACDIAARRLRVSGKSPIRAAYQFEGDGARLAASLLFPVHSVDRLGRMVLHQADGDATEI